MNTPSTLALNVSTYPLKKAQIVGAATTMSGLCAWKLQGAGIPRITITTILTMTTGTTALETGTNGTTTAMTGASGLRQETTQQ